MSDPRRPEVLVFEDVPDGHHLVYVRHLVDALDQRGVRPVLALTKGVLGSDHYARMLASVADRFDIELVAEGTGQRLVTRHLRRARILFRALATHRPRHAVVPYLDGIGFVLPALAGLARWSRRHTASVDALVMRVPLGNGRSARGKRLALISLLALGVIDRLHAIDELSHAALVRSAGPWRARVVFTPDPVLNPPVPDDDPAVLRAELGLPPQRRILLCIGMLSERKGISALVRAATSATWPADATLLLVGKIHDGIRDALETPAVEAAVAAGSVIVREGFASPEDYARYLKAADAISAIYVGHVGSSGVVVEAAASDVPVVAVDEGWIGHVVRRHGLGVLVDALDPDTVTAAFDASRGQRPADAAGFLARRHLAGFADSLLQGLPPR